MLIDYSPSLLLRLDLVTSFLCRHNAGLPFCKQQGGRKQSYIKNAIISFRRPATDTHSNTPLASFSWMVGLCVCSLTSRFYYSTYLFDFDVFMDGSCTVFDLTLVS